MPDQTGSNQKQGRKMVKDIIRQDKDIENKIYSIRDMQVMMDADLAQLYNVETKALNQAVSRNIKRFPENFRFQLTDKEYEKTLKSQNVTSKGRGGRRTNPYVFTEQGVAMLSGILRSDIAIKVSIQIMNAFVNLRRFIIKNAQVFQRLDDLEINQIKTEQKIEKVLKKIDNKTIIPKQGLFFDGQVFDAHKLVSDILRSANESIVLIDNYIDDSVIANFAKKQDKVTVEIFTNKVTTQLRQDVKKFNRQYGGMVLKKLNRSHDRFLIIDTETVYHIGASLKDLGKKWFAFSKIENYAAEILNKINKGQG